MRVARVGVVAAAVAGVWMAGPLGCAVTFEDWPLVEDAGVGGSASLGGGSGSDICGALTDCGGTCVDVETSAEHCGACERSCGDNQQCLVGQCACAGGFALCSGQCVNLQEDAQNCGGCGTRCLVGQVCSQGRCATVCDSGLTICGQACVNVTTSTEHCGVCDNACTGGQTCVSGRCTCVDGTTLCNGTCVFTDTNNEHCGGCNRPCLSGDCTGGVCPGGVGGTGGVSGSGGTGGVSGSGGTGGLAVGGTGGDSGGTGGATAGVGGETSAVGGAAGAGGMAQPAGGTVGEAGHAGAAGMGPAGAPGVGGSGTGGGGTGGGGTGGGGTGGGGTGGGSTGGGACPDPASGTLVLDVIDDMEDGDNSILAQGTPERVGHWYTYSDSTGTVSDELPLATEITDRSGSDYAIWMSASDTTSYGAGIGVDLNNDGSDKQAYDASAYDGITFWAKGSATGGSLRFKALIYAIVSPAEDGGCAEGNDCNNGHGINLTGLSDEWQQFTFTFCDLSQESWGYRVDFDSSEILTLQFQGNDGVDFEIWIDDLAFFAVE